MIMGANGFSYNLRLRGRALPQKLKNFHHKIYSLQMDNRLHTHARKPTRQFIFQNRKVKEKNVPFCG